MEITLEKYNSILAMMQSVDEENKVVALTIVDQLSFGDNITKILLLKKHSISSIGLWKENAPNTYKKLMELEEQGLLDTSLNLTYKVVLKTIVNMGVSHTDFSFYWNDFARYLTQQAQDYNYKGID